MKATCALAVLSLTFIHWVSSAHAVTFDWAIVGNPGNSGELSGTSAGGSGPDVIVGGVDYTYRISKYEVTNNQYSTFLNAVAGLGDPHGLYNTNMAGDYGGITRSGSGTSADPYVYVTKGGRHQLAQPSRELRLVFRRDAVCQLA